MTTSNYLNSAKGQLAVLVKMAKANNEVKGSEGMFLKIMARKLNISDLDFEDIYNNTEKYSFSPPVNQEDKFVLFYMIIQMMKVDLSVDIEEIEFCKEIGALLDISIKKIDEIIKLSILKNKEVVPYETIKEMLVN